MLGKQTRSNIRTKRLTGVRFNVLSSQLTKRTSVVTVVSPTGTEGGRPKPGGPLDLRLGTTNRELCPTCGLGHDCPGHTGILPLAIQIINPIFFDTVVTVLKLVCIQSARLLLPLSDPRVQQIRELPTKQRLAVYREMVNKLVKTSPYTGTKVPPVSHIRGNSDGNHLIAIEYPCETNTGEGAGRSRGGKTVKNILSPKDCLSILDGIPSDEKEFLGIPNLRDLVFESVPISPNAIRPATHLRQQNITFENGLSNAYANIVRSSSAIEEHRKKENMGGETNPGTLNRLASNLEKAIYSIYDTNAATKATGASNPNTAKGRLEGKTGRFRGNLLGKRVNYSGRSTITGDPEIPSDTISLPLKIAMGLTTPEQVTHSNIEQMRELCRNGPQRYPGANSIVTPNGRTYDLSFGYNFHISEIQIGWVVNRHLVDGDSTFVNRQPSLHRMSMMNFKIRVDRSGKQHTIGLPMAVTTAFNADFDGDEMNIFLMQRTSSRIAGTLLANPNTQVVSPTNSDSIINVKQDGITGIFLFTHPSNDRMDRSLVWRLLSHTTLSEDLIQGRLSVENRPYSGKEVFSMLMGQMINISWKNSVGDLLIRNGRLELGQITKMEVGSTKNNIIQQTLVCYGSDAVRDFIDNVHRLANVWLTTCSGFSIGIKDCIPSPKMLLSCQNTVREKVDDINHQIEHMEGSPNEMSPNQFDESVFASTNTTAPLISMQFMNDPLFRHNSLWKMIKSGAKGKDINCAQIMGIVGAQSFRGQNNRYPATVNGRVLPFFPSGDLSPKSRGFVEHSFKDGLTPAEATICSMSGRDGIVDTTAKTPTVGYLQRKLQFALANLAMTYTGQIADESGHIVQMSYGETGLDPSSQTEVRIPYVGMTDEEIGAEYRMSESELKTAQWTSSENTDYVDKISSLRNRLRKRQFEASHRFDLVNTNYYLVNIPQIVQHHSPVGTDVRPATKEATTKEEKKTQKKGADALISAADCIEAVRYIVEYTSRADPAARSSQDQTAEPTNRLILRAALLHYLSPKSLVLTHRLSKRALAFIVHDIVARYKNALCQPGTMAGVNAAQDASEASTQGALDAHRHSGRVTKGTGGITRILEVVSHTSDMSKPTMTIRLKQPWGTDRMFATRLASQLPLTTLSSLSNNIQLIYDPNPETSKYGSEVHPIVSHVNHSEQPTLDTYPWLLRFELREETMSRSHLNLDIIRTSVVRAWSTLLEEVKHKPKDRAIIADIGRNLCSCTSTDDHETLIVHVRFASTKFDSHSYFASVLDLIADSLQLCGLDGVSAADVVEMTDHRTVQKPPMTEFVIETNGINMSNQLLRFREIEQTRTTVDDMCQIHSLYGIEAVRASIVSQLKQVFDNAGTIVNHQHISLIADTMTYAGFVAPVSRYGIAKLDYSVLTRAGFEQPLSVLAGAAVSGESDNLTSVSSRIMTGQTIKGGTGYFEVFVDESKLPLQIPESVRHLRPYDIACHIILSGNAPLLVSRPLPNGDREVFRLDELITRENIKDVALLLNSYHGGSGGVTHVVE